MSERGYMNTVGKIPLYIYQYKKMPESDASKTHTQICCYVVSAEKFLKCNPYYEVHSAICEMAVEMSMTKKKVYEDEIGKVLTKDTPGITYPTVILKERDTIRAKDLFQENIEAEIRSAESMIAEYRKDQSRIGILPVNYNSLPDMIP